MKMEIETNKGIFKDDICNRLGCKGIIHEHPKEGSCSCHINPPCGYCTTDAAYCPVCDWSREEELNEVEFTQSPADALFNKKMMDKHRDHRENLYKQMRGELPITKLDYECNEHTHFTEEKYGVYPASMTKDQVLEKVRGTFGGRFKRFGNGVFRYIAYTD